MRQQVILDLLQQQLLKLLKVAMEDRPLGQMDFQRQRQIQRNPHSDISRRGNPPHRRGSLQVHRNHPLQALENLKLNNEILLKRTALRPILDGFMRKLQLHLGNNFLPIVHHRKRHRMRLLNNAKRKPKNRRD